MFHRLVNQNRVKPGGAYEQDYSLITSEVRPLLEVDRNALERRSR
jgi:hypothetical protein